jgi:hypothetical protein
LKKAQIENLKMILVFFGAISSFSFQSFMGLPAFKRLEAP